MIVASRLGAWTAESIGRYSWLALLALQPFNQFGTLRQIVVLSLLASLVITGWRAWRLRHFAWPRPGIVVATALALAAWAIAVSLLGPYPLDSVHELRKALLIQGLMLAGGLCYVASTADLRRAIAWTLGGFAVLSLLSAGAVLHYFWSQGFDLNIPRSHSDWWGGYGATGSCMIALLVGISLMPGLEGWQRVGSVIMAALAAALVVLYGSRTPLVVMILGVLLVALLGRYWRLMGGVVLTGVAAIIVLSLMPGEQSDRYRSLLHGRTYISNEGLSQRPALWEGMVEVIRERPLTGYGYGWKKLAWAINDGGFAARWKQEDGRKAAYFLAGKDEASYGRVNAHNYFLQVVFEIGAPGLLLALAFWTLLTKRTAALLRRNTPAEDRALGVAVLSLVGAYWLSNFTNGQWEGGLVNVTLALAAGALALSRREADA